MTGLLVKLVRIIAISTFSQGVGIDNIPQTDVIQTVEQTEGTNYLGYHLVITGFAYDSLVNRTANRRYVRNNSKDMIATMLCENGTFDPNAKSATRDSGICQLNNHRGNYQRLHDPRWNSEDEIEQFQFQRQACLDKWNLVQNHNKIWSCYNKRQRRLDMIIDMEGGTWGIDDE